MLLKVISIGLLAPCRRFTFGKNRYTYSFAWVQRDCMYSVSQQPILPFLITFMHARVYC